MVRISNLIDLRLLIFTQDTTTFPCFLAQVGVTFTGVVLYCGSIIRSASFDAKQFPDDSHFNPHFNWERNTSFASLLTAFLETIVNVTNSFSTGHAGLW